MKEIPLTQGKVALVDDRDYGYLMARLKFNGVENHLGVFASLQDAVSARKAAEEKYVGEFAFNN